MILNFKNMSDKQSQPPSQPVMYLPQSSPYDTLGLTPQATAEEIKSAYFALVRLHPPERDAARFKEIRAAYDHLKTPTQRFETDMRCWQDFQAPPLPPTTGLDLSVHDDDLLFLLQASSDLAAHNLHKQFRDIRL